MPAAPSPSPWLGGSHWSPAVAPASARRSRSALPPKEPASSSSTWTPPPLWPLRAGSEPPTGCRCPADVTNPAAVRKAIDAAALAFGGVDLVVNNAGLSISKPLLETTEADWDLQHDVMAKGSFLVSRAAAGAMIEQGIGGDIVYISSKNSV